MQIIKWLLLSLLCFTAPSEINALHKATQESSKKQVITEIPASGIVIDSPGTYVFGNDIIWNPSSDGQAILITANDVTLDLQYYMLQSPVTTFTTTGIRATTVSNLTIKHGTIANMVFRGIDCDTCLNVLIKHITVDGLSLQNIVDFVVPTGILVTNSSVATIKNCKVKNIDVRTASSAAIQLTKTYDSKVTNCHISNLINRDGAGTGIGHLFCDTAEVRSCTLDNIKTEFVDNLNTEGHTAIGIIPVLSINLKIEKCKISNIVGCCDDAHGLSVFECAGAIVKKCQVENVLDGTGAAQTGAKATGIEVYASGVKVSGCTVKNIVAINPQDKQATGFSCAQCIGVEFIWCHAENVHVYNQFGEENQVLGYGTGFGWAPDPRIVQPAIDVLYKYCTAKNCQVGFDSWFHINSVWDNIYSDCNGIPILGADQPPRTLSCDPCSECGCTVAGCRPDPFSITIDNVAANNTFEDVRIRKCKH